MSAALRLGPFLFRPRLLPTLLTLLLVPALAALGVWQLHRAEFKRELMARFEQRASDAPIALDGSQSDPQAMAYRRVIARGSYLAGRQLLLDNRTHQGRAGYQVLTPLRLEHGDGAVLVNRGWVPVGASRDKLPDVDVDPSPREVQGQAHVPGEAIVLGQEASQPGLWPKVVQSIDFQRAERLSGLRLLPYTLRLDPQAPDGYVRDWRPYYGIGPERHKAYAFQWFSLSLLLGIIYVGVNTRRARPGAQEQDTPDED